MANILKPLGLVVATILLWTGAGAYLIIDLMRIMGNDSYNWLGTALVTLINILTFIMSTDIFRRIAIKKNLYTTYLKLLYLIFIILAVTGLYISYNGPANPTKPFSENVIEYAAIWIFLQTLYLNDKKNIDIEDSINMFWGAIYAFGNLLTFVYLTFFDTNYNWWNWMILIPINSFLASIWPFFGYFSYGCPDSFSFQLSYMIKTITPTISPISSVSLILIY